MKRLRMTAHQDGRTPTTIADGRQVNTTVCTDPQTVERIKFPILMTVRQYWFLERVALGAYCTT